jgi:lipopolysaccharide/colanic/teichoic acid biosynthesis glycosyltransferase
MSALGGLACAIQSAIFLRYVPQQNLSETFLALTILAVLFLNTATIAAILTLSARQSKSRLLLSFTFNFLAHFVWLSFAKEVAWGFVPATYLAALACSLVVDSLCKSARTRRVGALVLGLSPGTLRRLDSEVEFITDPFTDASQYDVLLLDFAIVLPPEWARLVSSAALSNCDVRHVRDYVIQRTAYLLPDDVEPEFIQRNLTRNSLYVSVKRRIDIFATLLMAPIALLLGGLAALAILINMGRPIIFTQDRVGRKGRVFRMYKLRTMCSQNPSGKQIATSKSDCRVTPLGKILRRFRIDELPQLLNVLKGDMSLIGPRPEQPQLVEEYKQLMPHYDLRHEVQPGLSGWAQVSFGYASTVEETREKLTYDLFYIKEFGLVLDVEIALATLWILMTGRNAR